jgi:hypothetical protein
MIDKEHKMFIFNGWFGFWIFMTVFLLCDTYLYSKGHETMFWKHKTVEEKQIQQHQIERMKGDGPSV